jgi:chromosome segregation ATPase
VRAGNEPGQRRALAIGRRVALAGARERQREILEQELAAEQRALTQARQALAEQEAVRGGEERNYSRVESRLQPYKESVENHQKNIEALQRELANLK